MLFGGDSKAGNDSFFEWLFTIGIKDHRNSIVDAVASRCSKLDPDIYNRELYIHHFPGTNK